MRWSLSDEKKTFFLWGCPLLPEQPSFFKMFLSQTGFWAKFCHISLCINRHSPTTLLGTMYDCLLTQTANQPASTQCIQACRRGEDDLLNSKAASEKKGIEVTLNIVNGVVSQTAADLLTYPHYQPSRVHSEGSQEGKTSSEHHSFLWRKMPR